MTAQEVYNWLQIFFDVCLLLAFSQELPWTK